MNRTTKTMLWSLALTAAAIACGTDGASGSAGKDGEPGKAGGEGKAGSEGKPGAPGTGLSSSGGASAAHTLSFAPVSAPATDDDKRAVLATSKARIDGRDAPISFVTEARSGQAFGAATFGLVVDKNGAPIKNADGSSFVSPSNDFSSILKVGAKLYEITHFETTPASMYLSELAQDAAGNLAIKSTKPIDFSGVNGLWTPCAGSVSPWNTHLGSEEYPNDARQYETAETLAQVTGSFNTNMVRYWGLDPATTTAAQAKVVFNPYNYGWLTEVSLDAAAKPTAKKHYAAGRRALELAYVMPDQRTVYLTDDGTNDAFYMFIAKTAGDLSEGRLFAARWFQTSPAGAPGGNADISWIELGPNAKDSQVRALIDGGIKFSDIFEVEAPAGGTCPSAGGGFRSTVVDLGYGVVTECLKLKAGQELAASRLESRRYAAYLGATTELRKNEGMTFDPDGSRLYVAFSELNNGTMDNHPTRDLGGPNHIRLAENPCGAVYEYVISPDRQLGSDYVARSAKAVIEGTWLANPASPNPYPADSPYFGKNTCAVSNIANPDNLTFLPGYGVLLIGEDSGAEHQNDAVWAYDIRTRELTRILSTPYGAETTGLYFYPNLNGHAYIKVQVQHPYGESDQGMLTNPADARSYTGYLGPLPAMAP